MWSEFFSKSWFKFMFFFFFEDVSWHALCAKTVWSTNWLQRPHVRMDMQTVAVAKCWLQLSGWSKTIQIQKISCWWSQRLSSMRLSSEFLSIFWFCKLPCFRSVFLNVVQLLIWPCVLLQQHVNTNTHWALKVLRKQQQKQQQKQ